MLLLSLGQSAATTVLFGGKRLRYRQFCSPRAPVPAGASSGWELDYKNHGMEAMLGHLQADTTCA